MATKRATTKKKTAGRKGIKVGIDLGGMKATEDQLKRLHAYVANQVLTWIKVDVGGIATPVTVFGERPPNVNPPRPYDKE